MTFSFPYSIIPNIGGVLSSFFEPINQLWVNLFELENATIAILSDTTGLYVHLITLTILALIGSLIWWILFKWKQQKTIWEQFQIGIAYYLALTLFIYGFNKVFKWQFFFPEPNTLFTHVGQMTPDILYWSSIGSSYSYSLFSGMIEVIPACLLLFRKTRLLGALIAMMVLFNVVMINFGFDISVKIYSIFLFLLSFLLAIPHLRSLQHFFFSRPQPIIVDQNQYDSKPHSKSQLLLYAIGKPLIIGLIALEALFPYFRTQNFNDDLSEKPYLNGAYKVQSFYSTTEVKKKPKRIYIHRRGYFIIEYEDETQESLNLEYVNENRILKLMDTDSTVSFLSIIDQPDILLLSGLFKNQEIKMTSTKISLEDLPIKGDHFHWTVDSY